MAALLDACGRLVAPTPLVFGPRTVPVGAQERRRLRRKITVVLLLKDVLPEDSGAVAGRRKGSPKRDTHHAVQAFADRVL